MQGAADRYAYLTTLPIYIFVATGIYKVLCNRALSINLLLLSGVAIYLLLLSNLTQTQVRVWNNPISLWEHVVRSSPDNGHAHGNLGSSYYRIGAYDKAASHYESAIKNNDFSASHLTTAAMTYIQLGKPDNALALYLLTLQSYAHLAYISPLTNCISLNTGLIYLQQGKAQEAKNLFLKIDPSSAQGNQALTLLAQISDDDGNTKNQKSFAYCKELSTYHMSESPSRSSTLIHRTAPY